MGYSYASYTNNRRIDLLIQEWLTVLGTGGAQYRESLAESQHPQLYEGSLFQNAELCHLLRFILKFVI